MVLLVTFSLRQKKKKNISHATSFDYILHNPPQKKRCTLNLNASDKSYVLKRKGITSDRNVNVLFWANINRGGHSKRLPDHR
jgi:hypothetical protein